jgi:hypothetical protein
MPARRVALTRAGHGLPEFSQQGQILALSPAAVDVLSPSGRTLSKERAGLIGPLGNVGLT